jgi:hypothetical protein
MSDLEVIVVDDASNDGTLEVAERLTARDARVRVVRNLRNLGEAAARNRALVCARGEWVALLDSDDAWLPERLARMLMEVGDADVVADDVLRVESGTGTAWSYLRQRWQPAFCAREPTWVTADKFVRHDLGVLKPIISRAFLARHSLAWDPAHQLAPDFFFALALLRNGARWLQLPQAYYLYFSRADSALSLRWLQEGADVVSITESLGRDLAMQGNSVLADDLECFVAAERISLVFETAHAQLRMGRGWAVMPIVFADPRILPRLLLHVGRRLWAWVDRRRHGWRLIEDGDRLILVAR